MASPWQYLFETRKQPSGSGSLRRNRFRPGMETLETRIAPVADLLPNLRVLDEYLSGWSIDTSTPGHVYISYSTAMYNGGPGPFYIQGTGVATTLPDGTPAELANQIIYRDDGTSYTRAAGAMEYHAGHGHIHFTDFALARLLYRGGPQDGQLVAQGEKTSFAILEMINYSNLPQRPEWPGGLGGGRTQGLRPGYADVYGPGLTGQSFEITGVPNGNYWLEVIADPLNHILESNETDNTARIAITLTGLPFSGFAVIESNPQEANAGPVDHVRVRFNRDVNAATLTPADIAFTRDGTAIAATSVVAASAREFDIYFAPQTQVGTYQMLIGPNIQDTSGAYLDQNNDGTADGTRTTDRYVNIFTITAPRVVSTSPVVGSPGTVNGLRVTFNQAIDPATFTAADVTAFSGPGGAIALSNITGVVAVTGTNNTTFDIRFTQQSATGAYSLTFGPNIRDALGRLMNQDGDLVLGEDPGDRYTATFNLNFVGPDPFGYTATAATYDYQSIVGQPGTFTILDYGDDSSATINLGTNTFNFYGTSYTGSQLFASTNGLITFGSGNTSYSNGALTSLSAPTIAALWDDWVTRNTGSKHILGRLVDGDGDGTVDKLLIEWNQPQHYSTSPSGVTFQAALQLNTGATPGTVTLYYPDLQTGDGTANGVSATVGIRGAGANVLEVANSVASAFVGDGKAIQFSVPRVASITRLDPGVTSEHHIRYQVTFTRAVTGVDLTDFAITTTGDLEEVELDSVTGSGASYIVTVDTGHHDGAVVSI
jgi:hypothetical protein